MSFNTDKLIIFSAPSGSGKSTIVNHLLSKTDLPLAFSISATTRLPRDLENDGVHYYFLNSINFKEDIEADKFIEYEEVYPDLFYGTYKSEIKRIWDSKQAVVFDIDVAGGIALKSKFPKESLSVFIQPPSIAELERRLRMRNTDQEEIIQMRVAKAKEELLTASKFDVILKNDDLPTALKEAEDLVSQFLKA
ncbi:MAG: guanylate kinase [Flavobacteriaceae bacterium]|nr:guanylate kinase [Flavobacteriaceae bacterium]